MNQNLLDTHVVLWFLRGEVKLGQTARKAIEKAEFNFVSVASLWEVTIKASLEKLDLGKSLQEFFLDLDDNGFKILEINKEHLICLNDLPFHHRDPFDRVIISQAQIENFTLISADQQFKKYDVQLLST